MICKGRACALHLTKEYEEGKNTEPGSINPYDFFDEYEKHYAFCIGQQKTWKHNSFKKELFENDWLKKQIIAANEEILGWSEIKKAAMLRPDLDECNC